MIPSNIYSEISPRYPEIRGKTAIITGSGRGIGRAIAIRLAREGARVVITSRTEAAVGETVEYIAAQGASAIGVPADLSVGEDIERVYKKADEAFGGVDILINNAADMHRKRFFDTTDQEFEYLMSVNVTAAFRCSALAATRMRARGGGAIVHVSSVGGLRSHWPGMPYDVSKGAIDSLTRTMGIDLAEHGIRVNAVAPGATYNKSVEPPPEKFLEEWHPWIPIRRLAGSLEIAAVVAFLVSDEASYIAGQVIYVDGGLTAQLGSRTTPL